MVVTQTPTPMISLPSQRFLAIALLCCAYILGLLCSSLPGGGFWLLGFGIAAALLRRSRLSLPLAWRYSPTAPWWLAAGGIALFASFYLHLAAPRPGPTDISHLLPPGQTSQSIQVMGTLTERPALTRRGSIQLWLSPRQATIAAGQTQTATGKLYVTVPRKAARNLHTGQSVTLTGQLYRPRPATRPHGFDFAAYLARDGAFAGLKGTQVQINQPGPTWGGGVIRDRIVQSLQKGTDSRTGALLGALVLGKNAADIPFDLKDSFIGAGLAHALAASGFQVSLILAIATALSRTWPVPQQIGLGATALLTYGLLSGGEASIVRAIGMGCASLIALGMQQQVRPAAALLVIATGMLLVKPLWIWDLGFQLSLLATLGLIATATPLTKRLDWLPPALASLIAVPLAATLWTLPLQLYTFGILPLYSLVANVLTALLLSLLTIGGFIASLAAVLWPALGSGVAGLSFWPMQLLMAIVNFFSQLPGHALALGTISPLQLWGLYLCLGLVWLIPGWQKHWRLAGALSFLLLVVPLWHLQTQRFQATLFDQTRIPMMTIAHPQGTVVLNSGDRWVASQSLVPFLQQQGINRIDWAIATDAPAPDQAGWPAVLRQIPITTLTRCIPQAIAPIASQPHPKRQIDLNPQERLTLGPVQMTLWRAQPTLLTFTMGSQTWLLAANSNEADFTAWRSTVQLPPIQVLWWFGGSLSPNVLTQLHPQTLVLSGKAIADETLATFAQNVSQVFWTERDGTLQWTPDGGFSPTVNPGENNLTPI
ncbi:MAG: ComEC/Rec2 family competence protein [Thermosynechococcaceae cyanobacterium]